MTALQLLYADLSRQYGLEGRGATQPNFFRFLARALHYRFLPNIFCRLSRAAYVHHVPLIPHVCTYLNLLLFGLEVTPRCEIGPGVFFAHSVGVVIGAARVGSNATFYQGVTLGARELTITYDPSTRPTIGNDVLLGAGCRVLGAVQIGDGAIVGANAVVLHSVPANATVAGVPARVISMQ
ncbi:MAG TPA: hypothetical protein VMT53_20030 [Terriglobales bacterium]|nr:hypothetical protein [Terriglobales bacterium]